MELDTFMQLAGPTIGAAMSAYGVAVLTQAEDAAAGATVNLGRRILQRVWQRRDERQRAALEADVREAAEESEDADAQAALRQAVKRTLRQHPELLAELAELLPRPEPRPAHFTVSGPGSVVNPGINYGSMTSTTTIHGGNSQ
ncbi:MULTISPECIES: hypothetical protein [Streptomyces]|uniref:Uncharacterized protein n=1 Tax=Streptomyces argyrophylli TaxID=2726118 RepID=A0A6M4PKT6_9ACTN|nr:MULTISPECIES: hypothetical protein [Streptomyces]QJS11681.1 hypothetical protein HKX69_21185 [Streptomyces argyrophyllae]